MKKVKKILQTGFRALNVLGLVTLLLISSLVIISPLVRADDLATADISVSPGQICPGETARLSWQADSADNVVISQGIGTVSASGHTDVSPTQTTTYEITATNSTSGSVAHASVTLVVGGSCGGGGDLATADISASPGQICPGQSSRLTWVTTNANDSVVSQGIGTVSASGHTDVSPTQTTTYEITATNSTSGSVAHASVTVVVQNNCGGNNNRPVIHLTGGDMPICLNANFTDPGATATDTEDGNITSNIIKTGSVNTAVTGMYILRYNVADSQGLAANEVTRTVSVQPCGGNTPPTLTLTGGNSSICVNTSFTDPGATATDAEDGNITSSIRTTGSVVTSVIGTYILRYNVTDSGGLSAPEVTRTVDVHSCGGGNTRPVINLNSGNTSICLNSTFTDPGATATDAEDGNITSRIVKTGTVNTAAVGQYILRYNVTDSGGLAAVEATKTIDVHTCGGGGGGGGPLLPSVSTNSCTNITNNGAMLNGLVDGNGASVTAWFEWGTDSSNLNNTTSQNTFNSSPTDYNYSISGLNAGTTYYFRAVAKTSASTVRGNVLPCTTPGNGGGIIIPPQIQPTGVVSSSTRVATVRARAGTPPVIKLASVPLQTIQCFAINNGNIPVNLSNPKLNQTNISTAPTTLSANALKSGVLFLPMSLFGWMILIILILILTILGQHLFAQMSDNRRVVVEHAHHY